MIVIALDLLISASFLFFLLLFYKGGNWLKSRCCRYSEQKHSSRYLSSLLRHVNKLLLTFFFAFCFSLNLLKTGIVPYDFILLLLYNIAVSLLIQGKYSLEDYEGLCTFILYWCFHRSALAAGFKSTRRFLNEQFIKKGNGILQHVAKFSRIVANRPNTFWLSWYSQRGHRFVK